MKSYPRLSIFFFLFTSCAPASPPTRSLTSLIVFLSSCSLSCFKLSKLAAFGLIRKWGKCNSVPACDQYVWVCVRPCLALNSNRLRFSSGWERGRQDVLSWLVHLSISDRDFREPCVTWHLESPPCFSLRLHHFQLSALTRSQPPLNPSVEARLHKRRLVMKRTCTWHAFTYSMDGLLEYRSLYGLQDIPWSN